MSCTQTDLTIDAVLADPVIGALMRADRVDVLRLEACLRSKARTLGQGRGGTAGQRVSQARRTAPAVSATGVSRTGVPAASAWAW